MNPASENSPENQQTPDLPQADGGALLNFERRQVEALIEPGLEVWVWSHSDKEWVSGVVDNTNLLQDRCLFEVRCEKSVDSNFLDGYGSSQHSGFHGVDWFVKQSDTPPADHPLAGLPELEYGRWICFETVTGVAWAEVALINSATKEFAIEPADNFGTPAEEMLVGREFFEFPEILEMDVLPAGFDGSPIQRGDVVVLPVDSELGQAAYRVSGYDARHEVLLLECVSMLPAGQRVAVAFSDFQRDGTVCPEGLLQDLFRDFPELASDGEKLVTFEHDGQTLVGIADIQDRKNTLPAFVEVLIDKSEEEILADESPFQPDVYNRYQVAPKDLKEVRSSRRGR